MPILASPAVVRVSYETALTTLGLSKHQPYLLLFQPRGARFRYSHVRNWISIGLPKSESDLLR